MGKGRGESRDGVSSSRRVRPTRNRETRRGQSTAIENIVDDVGIVVKKRELDLRTWVVVRTRRRFAKNTIKERLWRGWVSRDKGVSGRGREKERPEKGERGASCRPGQRRSRHKSVDIVCRLSTLNNDPSNQIQTLYGLIWPTQDDQILIDFFW